VGAPEGREPCGSGECPRYGPVDRGRSAASRFLAGKGLFAFLRQDFAAEEAEAVIEILMDRRQGVRPCEADGRDPRRNESVSVDLREMGFAFARQQAGLSISHSKVCPP
jgi:hypothetical protein